jgi:ATP-binding protein involved in chromosome partitioning
MMQINTNDILRALSSVSLPAGGADVVSAGMISGVSVRGGKVGFLITIDPADKDRLSPLRMQCEDAVRALAGVESVTAVLTAQNAEPIPPAPQSGYDKPRERAVWNLTPVEGVKKIIAVASGKGGVGKSTVAASLAVAAAMSGKRAGLLDADIYGPSVPRMMGLTAEKQPPVAAGKMQPPLAHGVACMSMGFITGDAPAVLRGPMISKTLHQLLRMTHWNNLDVLFIDMPPGTGDIHLSLVQQVPLAGAIIVTTPQEVAAMDARKCAQMFQKLGTPLLGVIENMTGEVFGYGGGEKLAQEFGVKLLGEIPLQARVREALDAGNPELTAPLFSGIVQQL